MKKMLNNELPVTKELVSYLIRKQCPQWANLNIRPILSYGSGNFIFTLGNEYVVRFRMTDSSVASIQKEYIWVPKISKYLSTLISVPIFKGRPDNCYPSYWLVHKMLSGENPSFEQENEYEFLAKDIAYFINELHQIKLPGGPASTRGMSLNERDEKTKISINKLYKEIDYKQITDLWEKLLDKSVSTYHPVWIHGDLLQTNILIKNNRLSAVIDFSDFGMGDPACDLVISWSLFNTRSRLIFKKTLKNIDDNLWYRGCAWALSIALVILPSYLGKNPVMESLAKRIVNNVMHSEE